MKKIYTLEVVPGPPVSFRISAWMTGTPIEKLQQIAELGNSTLQQFEHIEDLLLALEPLLRMEDSK